MKGEAESKIKWANKHTRKSETCQLISRGLQEEVTPRCNPHIVTLTLDRSDNILLYCRPLKRWNKCRV